MNSFFINNLIIIHFLLECIDEKISSHLMSRANFDNWDKSRVVIYKSFGKRIRFFCHFFPLTLSDYVMRKMMIGFGLELL